MRRACLSVLSFVLVGILGTVVGSAGSQTEKPLTSVVANLQTLEGSVTVRYPPGSEERAASVQRLLAEAMPFFQAKTGAPLSFTVALLGPPEWQAINPANATYGDFLPGVDTTLTPPIMVLPAVRGHAIDRMLRSLWGESEPPDGNRVSSSTALHEVGHLVTKQIGLPDPSSGWFGEFLAGYIAYVYLLEKQPEEAQFLDEVSAGMAHRIHPLHLALDQMGNGLGGRTLTSGSNSVWQRGSARWHVSRDGHLSKRPEP